MARPSNLLRKGDGWVEGMAKSFDELPLTLSMDEVARVLGVSRKVAYKLAHRKGFPVVRVGEKRLVVPKDLLKDWLHKNVGA